jgi:hypothetical protein
LEKCSQIKLTYSIKNQEVNLTLCSSDYTIYFLSKAMNSNEFKLFEMRFNKFKINEKLFFDLGDFIVKIKQNNDL